MMLEKRSFMQAPEIRADAARKTLRGYAAVFGSEADIDGQFREVIAPGAFRTSVNADDVRAYYGHDTGRLLGRKSKGTLRLAEDRRGLAVEIDLPDTTDGRDVEALIARGDLDGMSFGFRVRDNGEIWDFSSEPPIRTLTDVELFEVSVVANPAYADTTIALRSMAAARQCGREVQELRKNFNAMKLRHRIKQDLAERGRSKAD